MTENIWEKAWEENNTRWQQGQYNKHLVTYFHQLPIAKSLEVFVPLCGKSKDLLWLLKNGCKVTGVELCEKPIVEFFSESNLDYKIDRTRGYDIYTGENIKIIKADLFYLDTKFYSSFDFIYDRASLVAIEPAERSSYSNLLTKVLKPGGSILLITFSSDKPLQGPPYSVSETEVKSLFRKDFEINKLGHEKVDSSLVGEETNSIEVFRTSYHLKKLDK